MSCKEIVKLLLLNNADPLIKDNEGYNAITWGDKFEIISILIIFKVWYFY